MMSHRTPRLVRLCRRMSSWRSPLLRWPGRCRRWRQARHQRARPPPKSADRSRWWIRMGARSPTRSFAGSGCSSISAIRIVRMRVRSRLPASMRRSATLIRPGARKVQAIFITVDPERDTPAGHEGLCRRVRGCQHRWTHRHAEAGERGPERLIGFTPGVTTARTATIR